MECAIALGERGRITAPPNPWVGSVVVKEGELKGQGWHERPGASHAEVVALREAGKEARGSTLFVTLEPCSHTGRTGPCVEEIVRAGVRRVVVGVEDPDPRVSGRGIARLREAGIEVTVGTGEDKVRESLLPYLHHRRLGRPYCIAKGAVSIDGRIAAADGSSQWITGPEARDEVHRLRSRSQAVMVGLGTALADQPQLTARTDPPPPRQPLRVVVDSQGRFGGEGWLVATTLQKEGAEFLICDEEEGRVSLLHLLRQLAERGVVQLLVEGGSQIFGSLLHRHLIDELHLFVGPVVLGSGGTPLFSGEVAKSIKEAPKFALHSVCRFGESARLIYRRIENGC